MGSTAFEILGKQIPKQQQSLRSVHEISQDKQENTPRTASSAMPPTQDSLKGAAVARSELNYCEYNKYRLRES